MFCMRSLHSSIWHLAAHDAAHDAAPLRVVCPEHLFEEYWCGMLENAWSWLKHANAWHTRQLNVDFELQGHNLILQEVPWPAVYAVE